MDDQLEPQGQEQEEEATDTNESVEETNTMETSPIEADSQATLLLNLEEMIKRHISSIEKLQIELKKHQEMFNDAFENSEAYRTNAEAAKEAQRLKSTTKQEITKQPQMIQLADRIKTMREEMKDLKFALSDYLVEFQRLSGLKEIQDEEGEFREIINSARAIKKATKRK